MSTRIVTEATSQQAISRITVLHHEPAPQPNKVSQRGQERALHGLEVLLRRRFINDHKTILKIPAVIVAIPSNHQEQQEAQTYLALATHSRITSEVPAITLVLRGEIMMVGAIGSAGPPISEEERK